MSRFRSVLLPRQWADAGLEAVLAQAGVRIVRPSQYMDKWRLDHTGVRPMKSDHVKRPLGFTGMLPRPNGA